MRFTFYQRLSLLAVFWTAMMTLSTSVFAAKADTRCTVANAETATTLQSHKVRPGETLGSILAKLGYGKLWCATCAVATTAKLNELDNANRLHVNQVLRIRAKALKTQIACLDDSNSERDVASESVTGSAIEPVPVEAPPPSVEKPPPEKSEPRPFESEIFFGIPLHVVSVDGIDKSDRTKGSLLTGTNPGVQLAWRLKFSDKWETELSTRYETDTIQPDINSVNIENREQKIGASSASVRYGSIVRLGLDLKSRDRLVYRAASGPGIRVQTLPSKSVGASLDAVLVRISSLSLRAAVGYESLLADANLGSGSAYNGRFILRQDFEHWALEGEVGYENSQFQTKLLEISGSDLWVTWGILWKL